MISIILITDDDELLYKPLDILINNNNLIPIIQRIKSDICVAVKYKVFSLIYYIKDNSFDTNLKIFNLRSKFLGLSQFNVTYYYCNSTCLRCLGPRNSQCTQCLTNYVLLSSLVNISNNYCVCNGSNFKNSTQDNAPCFDKNNGNIY